MEMPLFNGKSLSKKKYMICIFSILITSFLLLINLGLTSTAKAAITGNLYVDARLGFSLQIPDSWLVTPVKGKFEPSNMSGLTISTSKTKDGKIGISVIRDITNPEAFAQRGMPSEYLNNYPAFILDTFGQQQFTQPCLIRVMLANNDLVTATWCADHASIYKNQFEHLLATYRLASSAPSSTTIMPATVNANSCAQMINVYANEGYTEPASNSRGDWGTQQLDPTDARWTANFNPGTAVCDNFSSSSANEGFNTYPFQCVELAMRFLNEQWGLTPQFTVNAEYYYDYYDGSGYHQGQAVSLYGNNVQLSDDATQVGSDPNHAHPSFAPSPGDLLIWQTINDTSKGWSSGIVPGTTGHVAVITDVTSTDVYIAQQNYMPNGYYEKLTLTNNASGWSISGLPFYDTHTIVRGWIHFKADPYSAGGSTGTTNNTSPKPSPLVIKYANGSQDVIAVGKDGRMWHKWAGANGSWIDWNWWSNNTDFAATTPTLVHYGDGSMDVIAVGKDGRMWHKWADANGNWIDWNWWSNNTDFAAVGPVIKYADGSQDVLAVGKDGRMWHRWAAANGSWIDWNWWGNNTDFAPVAPTLVKYGDGSMDIIAVGKDGRMWHKWAAANGSWINWNWWSDPNFAIATPALVKYSDGSMDIIAVGNDGRMWHRWAGTNGSWIDWNWWSSGTQFASTGPLVVKYSDGSQDVIAVDKDGRMWHKWAGANNSWIDWNWWSNNTDFTAATPALVQYGDGSKDVIAVGKDGRMWHKWAGANNSWIDWNWWSSGTQFAS